MHISQSILMPLFFTCLSLEIFFLIRLYSVAPIFQGGWTTTGQSAFLLVREGVTSFMRANFTPYITKIQEIPWAPTSTGLTGSQKAAPETEKKSTHNQNSWIPPCNICDPYEVYQKHMMAISVWFCVFFGIVTLKCRSVATSIQTPYHPRANERSNPQQNTSDPWSFENGFWCNYVCIFQKVTLIKVLQCDVTAYYCVKAIALSSMCNLRKRIRATYPFLCTRFSVKYTLFLQILHCFSCKFCSFFCINYMYVSLWNPLIPDDL